MRTLLAVTLAFLPLLQAQDSLLLKSVEPKYDKYSPELATDFDTAIASVTITVAADGKPFAFHSAPLPMAVVMALKDYEFRPQGTVPHGRPASDVTYQVTLNVPIRKSKEPRQQNKPVQLSPGIARGMVVQRDPPAYPESARHAGIQGRIVLETVISKNGDVESLKASAGQFVLIEAAYEAAKQWKFRPYLLNLEPVEVLTYIDVPFPTPFLEPL